VVRSLLTDALCHVVIVGGGPTGVELAAEIADLCRHTFARYYAADLISSLRITLVQRGSELVPQFSETVRRRSLETLHHKGVDVRFHTSVTQVTDHSVTLDNGEVILEAV